MPQSNLLPALSALWQDRQDFLFLPKQHHNPPKHLTYFTLTCGDHTILPTHESQKRYFLTMVDDFSRSTWSQLLSCKSNALHTIKALICLIETQFNTIVKAIRTDNGLEFINKETSDFLQDKGIIHQRTCTYTP